MLFDYLNVFTHYQIEQRHNEAKSIQKNRKMLRKKNWKELKNDEKKITAKCWNIFLKSVKKRIEKYWNIFLKSVLFEKRTEKCIKKNRN